MNTNTSDEELEKHKKIYFDYHLSHYKNIRHQEITARDIVNYQYSASYRWGADSGIPYKIGKPHISVSPKEKAINYAKNSYGQKLHNYSNFLTIGLDKIASILSGENIFMGTIIGIPATILTVIATKDPSFFALGFSALVTAGVISYTSRKISNNIVDEKITTIVTKMTEEYAKNFKSNFHSDTKDIENDIFNEKPILNTNKETTKNISSTQSIKDKIISLRKNTENLHIKPLPQV